MEAHWLTIFIVMLGMFVTPFYWFVILPKKKALPLAFTCMILAAAATTFVLFGGVELFGPLGGLIIAFMWIVPAAIVWFNRSFFEGVDQRPLMGLQIFRILGGVFIIEMFRGRIPGSFAWPAGIGDVLVGVLALIFVFYKKTPIWAIWTVLILGVLDFLSAFFFGNTSFAGPLQLFALGFDNQLNSFPTGLIPLYLVPYAIVFHVISFINIKRKVNV